MSSFDDSSAPFLKAEDFDDECKASTEAEYRPLSLPTCIQQQSRRVKVLIGLGFLLTLCFGIAGGYLLRGTIPTATFHSESVVLRTFQAEPIFSDPPSDVSDAAWDAMIPRGRGFVKVQDSIPRSGDDGLYCVSAFHQLHCLDTIRHGYFEAVRMLSSSPRPTRVAPDGGPASPVPEDFRHHDNSRKSGHHHDASHMQHCFDYIRQALICAADPTLEKRNDTISGVKGWGTTHQCRDFEALKKLTEEHRYSDEVGISN